MKGLKISVGLDPVYKFGVALVGTQTRLQPRVSAL